MQAQDKRYDLTYFIDGDRKHAEDLSWVNLGFILRDLADALLDKPELKIGDVDIEIA